LERKDSSGKIKIMHTSTHTFILSTDSSFYPVISIQKKSEGRQRRTDSLRCATRMSTEKREAKGEIGTVKEYLSNGN